jgi:hypothetical protein
MTHDFASQHASPAHSSQAYSGFLSILQSLCSLPFSILRAVVDFFAPPSALELSLRQRQTVHAQAPVAEFASTPACTNTQSPRTQLQIDSSQVNETALHTPNTMKKIATNDRPTVISAKKTLKTGLTMQHGRIIISGRMADVCAELERLAALEA